jgi:hypothetical protein
MSKPHTELFHVKLKPVKFNFQRYCDLKLYAGASEEELKI